MPSVRPLVPHQDVRPEQSDGAKLLGQRNLTRSGWPGLSREDPTTASATAVGGQGGWHGQLRPRLGHGVNTSCPFRKSFTTPGVVSPYGITIGTGGGLAKRTSSCVPVSVLAASPFASRRQPRRGSQVKRFLVEEGIGTDREFRAIFDREGGAT